MADVGKPIKRPGVTVNAPLAQALGLDGTTDAERLWVERMAEIRQAEVDAYSRGLHKSHHYGDVVDAFRAGWDAHMRRSPDSGSDQ